MIWDVLVYSLAALVSVVVLVATALTLFVVWIANGDPGVNGDPERDGGGR
jgi:hypothetical protein